MKTDICRTFDPYMKDICHRQTIMSWEIILSDGSSIWGDYERPGYMSCWDRVKLFFASNTDVKALEIKLYMFGAPTHTFFLDEDGLDGFSISRGIAKEQFMDGSFKDYQFLVVSLLRPEADNIDVKKFVWPFNEFEKSQSIRLPTGDNVSEMVFQNESEKFKKVQKHINGTAV